VWQSLQPEDRKLAPRAIFSPASSPASVPAAACDHAQRRERRREHAAAAIQRVSASENHSEVNDRNPNGRLGRLHRFE
jgi:hypothetical protein